ncbi:hypothetical protein AXG93_3228s1000 [Marchantia polymorpha subsp. ruderalis]|uniref:Uncharacterized protein n=1 Tax=Marchantia polymorpha subsp. ruderalis TaxID=1480154 RepID=A0A176WIV3_MARPO|nr:hypothetical protein AXG93_3228s1000 [Marchantia polymorpha subsp. ruderalis]
MKELGVLIGPGIRIELASDMPIFCRAYRYSEMKRDLIWSRTLDLLEAGLVELLHGEYASATVMPVKKDVHDNYTDRRMCGDYRHINRQTKSDKIPSVANLEGGQDQDNVLERQLSRQGLFVLVTILTPWVEECTCRVSEGYG